MLLPHGRRIWEGGASGRVSRSLFRSYPPGVCCPPCWAAAPALVAHPGCNAGWVGRQARPSPAACLGSPNQTAPRHEQQVMQSLGSKHSAEESRREGGHVSAAGFTHPASMLAYK
jgi:hypothetical protein